MEETCVVAHASDSRRGGIDQGGVRVERSRHSRARSLDCHRPPIVIRKGKLLLPMLHILYPGSKTSPTKR